MPPERGLTPDKIATVTCAELRPSLELGNDRGLFRYLLNDSDRLVYCFWGSCQVLKSRSDPPPPLVWATPRDPCTTPHPRFTHLRALARALPRAGSRCVSPVARSSFPNPLAGAARQPLHVQGSKLAQSIRSLQATLRTAAWSKRGPSCAERGLARGPERGSQSGAPWADRAM